MTHLLTKALSRFTKNSHHTTEPTWDSEKSTSSKINGPQAPGFNGIPIDFVLPSEARFAHGHFEYIQTPAVTARELVMTAVMGEITDITTWYLDIQEKHIVFKWKCKMMQQHTLLSEEAWIWCLAELRDKALEYQSKGFVRVVDTGSCACKSDKLLPASVATSLRTALEPFQDAAAEEPVVDPLMYPLVYGTSPVLDGGGITDLSSPLDGSRLYKGAQSVCAIAQGAHHRAPGLVQRSLDRYGVLENQRSRFWSGWCTGKECLAYSWSVRHQSLPCDVNFIGDSGCGVEIVSYINNLHPAHRLIYQDIEKIISASIMPWNECLIKGAAALHEETERRIVRGVGCTGNQTQYGRVPLRIVAYGAHWHNQTSLFALYHDEEWQKRRTALKWARKQIMRGNASRMTIVHGRRMEAWSIASQWEWLERLPPLPKLKNGGQGPSPVPITPWWEHPQPGRSFSYADWNSGRNVDQAVVKMISRPHRSDKSYAGPSHARYAVTLDQDFRQSGLQVIVAIDGFQLKPEAIPFMQTWRLDGLLNEHIVATSLYVYDVANMSASISFRQETPMPHAVYRYQSGHDARKGPVWCETDDAADITFNNTALAEELEALSEVFGFDDSADIDARSARKKLCYQQTGSVSLPQGRLVTWPNTIEHRLEAELVDPARPGHIRFVKVHLVDPHYRICSTANVPPQQQDWWEDEVQRILMDKGIPRELRDQILKATEPPMHVKQAQAHKAEMLKERDRARFTRYCQMEEYCF